MMPNRRHVFWCWSAVYAQDLSAIGKAKSTFPKVLYSSDRLIVLEAKHEKAAQRFVQALPRGFALNPRESGQDVCVGFAREMDNILSTRTEFKSTALHHIAQKCDVDVANVENKVIVKWYTEAVLCFEKEEKEENDMGQDEDKRDIDRRHSPVPVRSSGLLVLERKPEPYLQRLYDRMDHQRKELTEVMERVRMLEESNPSVDGTLPTAMDVAIQKQFDILAGHEHDIAKLRELISQQEKSYLSHLQTLEQTTKLQEKTYKEHIRMLEEASKVQEQSYKDHVKILEENLQKQEMAYEPLLTQLSDMKSKLEDSENIISEQSNRLEKQEQLLYKCNQQLSEHSKLLQWMESQMTKSTHRVHVEDERTPTPTKSRIANKTTSQSPRISRSPNYSISPRSPHRHPSPLPNQQP